MNPALGLTALIVVLVATVAVGVYGLRLSRATSDFYVASREISPLWNASAIGGEYLSAASFLGVAGLVMAYGVDMLAYPVGYTAGYLVLLLLVAAPLRRSGAYTLPDFAEERLGSTAVRRVASVLVAVIAWLYLVPQLQGAGLTLQTVTGAPRWVGAVVVAAAVVCVSAAGGMRSVTLVQGFQFWLKLTAIAVPAVFLILSWRAAGSPSLTGPDTPVFPHTTVVRIEDPVRFDVRAPVTITVRGRLDGTAYGTAGGPAGTVRLVKGEHAAAAGARLTFPAGVPVPQKTGLKPATGAMWASPLSGAGGRSHPLYAVYSILLATFLGTMGLPHVLVRFYTNPDGRAARRTTLLVLVLLSGFYLLPPVYGALGRIFAPQLLLTGRTDTAVLVLPQITQAGEGGRLLAALATAGAFAAFVSTASGLTVSVAGVVSQDLLRGSTRGFRWASLIAGVPPLLMATATTGLPVADAIGLAFAVAASSFCPLLVLGIWWRGLTDVGALLGLVAGGGLAAVAVVLTSVIGPGRGWPAALLEQPAAWTVPVAFTVMVAGSLLTRHRLSPAAVDRVMLRMHLPEEAGVLPPVPQGALAASAAAAARKAAGRRTVVPGRTGGPVGVGGPGGAGGPVGVGTPAGPAGPPDPAGGAARPAGNGGSAGQSRPDRPPAQAEEPPLH
ncbi:MULTISPECIES: sodium/solute symporter [unclassified Streptomyces]|uniref:sodium/solute symporter n=1 Tax=unclassified Streptomyces TaxID=2593676 RepID=UPI002E2B642F|nr:cation acetate symporter [Streptomyces sp. NBC_00223]